MKDVKDDKATKALTRLNPLATYDLQNLDTLVHEHKIDFWTKPNTKQWILIITIGILCG